MYVCMCELGFVDCPQCAVDVLSIRLLLIFEGFNDGSLRIAFFSLDRAGLSSWASGQRLYMIGCSDPLDDMLLYIWICRVIVVCYPFAPPTHGDLQSPRSGSASKLNFYPAYIVIGWIKLRLCICIAACYSCTTCTICMWFSLCRLESYVPALSSKWETATEFSSRCIVVA